MFGSQSVLKVWAPLIDDATKSVSTANVTAKYSITLITGVRHLRQLTQNKLSPTTFRMKIKQFINTVKERGQDIKIVLCSILPDTTPDMVDGADMMNSILQEFTNIPGVIYGDTWSRFADYHYSMNGVHPKPACAARITQTIIRALSSSQSTRINERTTRRQDHFPAPPWSTMQRNVSSTLQPLHGPQPSMQPTLRQPLHEPQRPMQPPSMRLSHGSPPLINQHPPHAHSPDVQSPPVQSRPMQPPPPFQLLHGSPPLVNQHPPHAQSPDVQSWPVQSPPVQSPPMQSPPVQSPPMQSPPVQSPPMQSPPVQSPHMQSPPVQSPHMQSPPVQSPPVQSPPVQSPHVCNQHLSNHHRCSHCLFNHHHQ